MTETNRKASATARTRATTKYHKAHYKRMYISTTPDQANYIRETAKKYNITIVQLIIDSIKLFEENAERLPAGAATTQPEQQAQPEQDPTESTIELGETAGAQPEEKTEEETENDIGTEEETTEEEEQAAGAEEPQEDEDEDEKPEEIPAFVWEQIQRLKKADKRHTAERKAREAAERKRRRAEESIEDY